MSESKEIEPPQEANSLFANRPFVVGLLFAGTVLTGISGFIGLVLAYVFRAQEHEEWEATHLRYLITTFWLAFAPICLIFVLAVASTGMGPNFGTFALLFIIGFITMVHALVRTVLSLMKSHIREPMPNAGSWTI